MGGDRFRVVPEGARHVDEFFVRGGDFLADDVQPVLADIQFLRRFVGIVDAGESVEFPLLHTRFQPRIIEVVEEEILPEIFVQIPK